MSTGHLTMAELLAVRDADRSEPAFAMAHLHVEGCPRCQTELDRLHQRVARMRALPLLSPATNVYPAVRRQLAHRRAQRVWRTVASLGVAAAAGLVLWLVGHSLAAPPPLSAEAQIADVKSSSERLQQRLDEWAPEQRALDGGTVIVVLELQDRIADVDRQLQQIDVGPPTSEVIELPMGQQDQHLSNELRLWREREGLLNALLTVHVNRTVRVEM
jgi:hypothetical protein